MGRESMWEVPSDHDVGPSCGSPRTWACLEAVGQALAGADDAAVCFLPPEDRRAALLRLVGFEARLAALRLRLLAASDDLAAAEGARDVAALVTHLTRTSGTDNRRDLALAQALDQRWLVLAAGLPTGAVNTPRPG